MRRRLHQEIREFATTTRGLLLLRDWLASFEVGLVGMEATGVYWKPIYYVLEDDFELWLGCPPPQERPRQEDRRERRRVDLPACGARAGAPQLRASRRDSGAKEPYPLPQSLRIEERTREVQRLEKVFRMPG